MGALRTVAVEFLGKRSGILSRGSQIGMVKNDGCTSPLERAGDLSADALGGSGDKGYLAF